MREAIPYSLWSKLKVACQAFKNSDFIHHSSSLMPRIYETVSPTRTVYGLLKVLRSIEANSVHGGSFVVYRALRWLCFPGLCCTDESLITGTSRAGQAVKDQH